MPQAGTLHQANREPDMSSRPLDPPEHAQLAHVHRLCIRPTQDLCFRLLTVMSTLRLLWFTLCVGSSKHKGCATNCSSQGTQHMSDAVLHHAED